MAGVVASEWIASLKTMGSAPGKSKDLAGKPEDGPVCVTGATGFIALHLVEQLLTKGYTVVGTVRTLGGERCEPLVAMQKTFGEDKLRLVGGVDCLKPETFVDAVKGCVGVFHTASPFTFKVDNYQDLVEPAVQGTLGCLKACYGGSVRRVVVTSSFAAIFNPGNPDYPWSYKYSSADWNVTSFPNEAGEMAAPIAPNGYRYSKIKAEKVAWDLVNSEAAAFDLVFINPPMVLGTNKNKVSVSGLNQSSEIILNILTGKSAPMPNSIGFVDVADVAKAHIVGYEQPSAGGKRFLTSGSCSTWLGIAKMLKEMYPSYPVNTDEPAGGEGELMDMDTTPLEELGMKWEPLRDTLKRQCDSLIELGLAK